MPATRKCCWPGAPCKAWARPLSHRRAVVPFFEGPRFTLVDAAFGPVFRYFDAFEALAGLHILGTLPSVAAWRSDLSLRPSAHAAVAADYPEMLRAFLMAKQSALSDRIAACALGGSVSSCWLKPLSLARWLSPEPCASAPRDDPACSRSFHRAGRSAPAVNNTSSGTSSRATKRLQASILLKSVVTEPLSQRARTPCL